MNHSADEQNAAILRRALERERKARACSESLLEKKSLELYRAQEKLTERVCELEKLNQELKASQVRLVQAEKLASLGTLVAGVGHEIHNPVGFVVSNLAALEEHVEFLFAVFEAYQAVRGCLASPVTPALQQKLDALDALLAKDDVRFILNDLRDIGQESGEGMDRIRAIVNALRTFSRADDPAPVPYDVNDAVNNAIRIVGSELRNRSSLTTDLATCPSIPCFPGQINQLVLNLVVNAADALGSGGAIEIRTRETDSGIELCVTDDGPGIESEHLDRLFDPFFTTKPVGKGTGLGLAIVYDIVKAHRGDISVDSTVGQGSTFRIQLPKGE